MKEPRSLRDPRWMYLKATLFIVMGIACFVLLCIDRPKLTTALYATLMAWAFARAYYFAFYVVEHYIDDGYKFSGLISFARYLMARRRSKLENDPGTDRPV